MIFSHHFVHLDSLGTYQSKQLIGLILKMKGEILRLLSLKRPNIKMCGKNIPYLKNLNKKSLKLFYVEFRNELLS